MRELPVALLLALGLPALAADTPSKRGSGFFGFGAPPAEQISADLFPQGETAAAASGSGALSADGIFRGGQPQKVEPVSYVIENGRRVERPAPASVKKPEPAAPIQPLSSPTPAKPIVTAPAPAAVPTAAPVATPADPTAPSEKKRGSWFGFGKRDESAAAENPVLTPVPAAAPILGATPVSNEPAQSPKPSSKPKPLPAPVAAKPVETTAPSPVAASTRSGVTLSGVPLSGETPDFANVKEEKGEKFGWIPFLGRKKEETAPATPAIPAATPVPADTMAATVPAAKPVEKTMEKTAPKPAAPSPEKPVATETTPGAKPGDKPATPEVATFEIRRDESKPVEPDKKEKSDRDGSLLNPISKIRPKKEIDLTGAETIIQNGEIVAGSDPLAAAVQTDTTAPRQAPQVVNGVKTYSSWNDVDARSASAAEKIISRIR